MTAYRLLAAALLGAAAAAATAAPADYLLHNQTNEVLLDKAAAQAVWREKLTDARVARLAKLYPQRKWGFAGEVQGGFNADKVCVVAARAMLVPRSGKLLQLAPEKSAATFDAQPGATQAQCQALAKAKLGEAIDAVLSSLITR